MRRKPWQRVKGRRWGDCEYYESKENGYDENVRGKRVRKGDEERGLRDGFKER